MGIMPHQLSIDEVGRVMYTSLDYGMETLNLPSADSITLRGLLDSGVGWGQPATDTSGRDEVEQVVNVEQIESDLTTGYPDRRGLQYLRYGGVANAHIELKNDLVEENHAMTEDGRKKARKNILKDYAKKHVVIRNKSFEWVREHNIGAIAKSRKDRQLLAMQKACTWRVIDDCSDSGSNGESVNSMTGPHGTLALAQGEKIAEVCRRTSEIAKKKGRDVSRIVGIKIDIASAYRNFKIAYSDRWLFGFRFEGKYYIHTSWPFGAVASVYNFLRIPLMIVYYLAVASWWGEEGVEAAMYFDDLTIIGHQEVIERAGQEALDLFDRWKIPRQDAKWREENINGLKGSHVLTIMGLEYNFRDMTVGIPLQRLRDIMDEIQTFIAEASKVGKNFKRWESIIGVMSWCSITIPQLRPLLTGTWYFKRVWQNVGKEKGIRRISKDIRDDWELFMEYASRWSGTSAIFREKLIPAGKSGYGNDRIDPAADASGTIGWGIVSEFGYAKGKWSEEELKLPIHLKEGLALFMLIALTGNKLQKKDWRVLLRSDNQGLVKSLRRGRSKDLRLNIIVQLIVTELLKYDMVLRCWKTKGKRIADVEFIGTKENVLADALSRFDMETYTNITNKLPFKQAQQEIRIPEEVTTNWTRAVRRMIENS